MTNDHYDLIIIGSGSGNMIPGEVDIADWRIAVVEATKLGGTCLNRGCIPSKILVYTADVADGVRHAGRYNLGATLDHVDWEAIKNRVWNRIDPIPQQGIDYRRRHGIDVFECAARFVGPKAIDVDGRVITADRFVISAGCRTVVPDLPGLDSVPYETSDTIMRIAEVPRHLVILGGGFIATELGHVFGALGAKVTIIGRRDQLLPFEDRAISHAFTEAAHEWADLVLGAEPTSVRQTDDGIAVTVPTADGERVIEGDTLLVAVGRRANTDTLDVAATGVAVDGNGFVVVDETYETAVPGIWALGDIVGYHQLKHTANIEARIVAHNLRPGDAPLKTRDLRPAPHAVFSTPQVAAVGLTEDEARDQDLDYVAITRAYSHAAYGWAMEDTSSFVKVLADPKTRLLLGAHVVGPQAANLLQLLVQGMHLGSTIDELAKGQIYIHPALTEVVEQALLDLIKAVDNHKP